jgi:hypothetical protein
VQHGRVAAPGGDAVQFVEEVLSGNGALDQAAEALGRVSRMARNRSGVSAKAGRMELSYRSGMRSVKNSTSSEAAGGSRLLRLTTT